MQSLHCHEDDEWNRTSSWLESTVIIVPGSTNIRLTVKVLRQKSIKTEEALVASRLATIDGVGGDTGNTVTSLAHRGTVPHRSLDFFYSNTNHVVQLEDTTIKTERSCSMQRTEQKRVLHHSSLGLHCRGCPDQISCGGGINIPNTMQ